MLTVTMPARGVNINCAAGRLWTTETICRTCDILATGAASKTWKCFRQDQGVSSSGGTAAR
jgi:hypothetical protein